MARLQYLPASPGLPDDSAVRGVRTLPAAWVDPSPPSAIVPDDDGHDGWQPVRLRSAAAGSPRDSYIRLRKVD